MRIALVILILTIVCAVAADEQPEGCSLRFDGSSYLSLDRFVSDKRHRGVLFDPAHGGFEAWVKPAPYLLGQHTDSAGVILQTGIILAKTPQSFVMKLDRGTLSVEKWTRLSTGDETWSLTKFTAIGFIPADTWTHISFDIASSAFVLNGQIMHINHNTLFYTESHPSCRFAIGANFTGSIDEVRIWNISRSPAAVQLSMKNGICADNDWANNGDLILHLSFDECSQNQNVTLDDSKARACAKMRPNSFMFAKKHHKRHHQDNQSDVKFPVSFKLVDVHSIGSFNRSRHAEFMKNRKQGHEEGHDGKYGHEGEHTDGHEGERKNKRWGGDVQLVYDAPAPLYKMSCAVVLDAVTQCPYAEYYKKFHPTHHSSEYDSDSDSDDEDYDFSLIWILVTVLVLMSCVSYFRRMRNRRNAASIYQALPQSVSVQQQELDGYPGAFQQQVPQAYAPVYDPRMFYMYHMPQMQVPPPNMMQVPHNMMQVPHLQMPVYYSPNQPWGAREEGANGQM